MDYKQYIVFGVLIATAIYAFFNLSKSLSYSRKLTGMLALILLMVVMSTSLLLAFISADKVKRMELAKGKCPEYVPINNVYILKK